MCLLQFALWKMDRLYEGKRDYNLFTAQLNTLFVMNPMSQRKERLFSLFFSFHHKLLAPPGILKSQCWWKRAQSIFIQVVKVVKFFIRNFVTRYHFQHSAIISSIPSPHRWSHYILPCLPNDKINTINLLTQSNMWVSIMWQSLTKIDIFSQGTIKVQSMALNFKKEM